MFNKKPTKKQLIVPAILLSILISIAVFNADTIKSVASTLKTNVTSIGIFDITNVQRNDYELEALVINPKLSESAQAKANDMAEKGYFAHVSPDGTKFTQWIKEADYKYLFAGENLAVKFENSEDVVEAWMNSIKHRDNILNQRFKEVGIGVSKGMYKGREVTFVVQHFGEPSPDFTALLEKLLNI